MFRIGDYYQINKVPIPLYTASDMALLRNNTTNGWVNEVGLYRIANVRYIDNGKIYLEPQSANSIAIIAIYGLNKTYIIGWIRDDDNISHARINSVSDYTIGQEQVNVKISGVMNGRYRTEILIGNEVVYTHNTETTHYNMTITPDVQARMLQLLPNVSLTRATVRVTTFVNNNRTGQATTQINLIVPESIKPAFMAPPTFEVHNPIYDIAYSGRTGIKVVVPQINAGQGATIRDVVIEAGDGQREVKLTGSATEHIFETVNRSGEVTARVTATDTRGRSISTSRTFTFVDLLQPQVELIQAYRDPNNTTDFIVEMNIRVDPMFAEQDIRIIPSYQETGTGIDYFKEPISVITDKFGGVMDYLYTFDGLETDKSYRVTLLVVDGLNGQTTLSATAGTEDYPLSLGAFGAGIGVLVDDYGAHLQVGEKGIHTLGDIQIGNTIIQVKTESYNVLSVEDDGIFFNGIPLIKTEPTQQYGDLDINIIE